MAGPLNVTVIDRADLTWALQTGSPGSSTTVHVRGMNGYREQIPVDPFPCYTHDAELVADLLRECSAVFPLAVPVDVVILPFETFDRCNAYTGQHFAYWRDGERLEPPEWVARVVIAGKRVPPHPAMTRYLVAHEYGHAVACAIAELLDGGDQPHVKQERLYAEYRALRGLPDHREDYGGGEWHTATAEVFACDFRALVAGREIEFWPHPGVPDPFTVAGLLEWWVRHADAARERLA